MACGGGARSVRSVVGWVIWIIWDAWPGKTGTGAGSRQQGMGMVEQAAVIPVAADFWVTQRLLEVGERIPCANGSEMQ